MTEIKKFIPKIVFKTDFENEVSIFCDMLADKEKPYRKMILSMIPKLRNLLDESDSKNESVIVHDFLVSFYEEKGEIINRVYNEAKEKTDKNGEEILTELSKLMEYEWEENHKGYTFIPTALPMSPFDVNKNIINFSLAQYLKKDPQPEDFNHSILATIAHEVSHLILRDILRKNNLLSTINPTILHLLQEVLAPVIMNQPKLKSILNTNEYYGNPYLKPIILEVEGKKINFVEYYSEKYNLMKNIENKSFLEIINVMIKEMKSIQTELEERMDLWNKYSIAVFSDQGLLSYFSEPIKLNI